MFEFCPIGRFHHANWMAASGYRFGWRKRPFPFVRAVASGAVLIEVRVECSAASFLLHIRALKSFYLAENYNLYAGCVFPLRTFQVTDEQPISQTQRASVSSIFKLKPTSPFAARFTPFAKARLIATLCPMLTFHCVLASRLHHP